MTCRLPLRGYLTGIGPRQSRAVNSGSAPRSNFIAAEMNWSTAQPTREHNDNGVIDPASLIDLDLCLSMGYEAVKLRIFVGNRAPDWAKALGGGPMAWVDDNQPDGYTVPVWWSMEYLDAYRLFVEALADQLKIRPEVFDVTISGPSTAYTEPLLRQTQFPPNRPVALAAGFQESKDVESIRWCIDIHHEFMSPLGIVSSLAVNPYQTFTSTGTTSRIDTTLDLLEYQFAVMGKYAVWANYSLGAKWVDGKAVQVRLEGTYPIMYDFLSQHAKSGRVPVEYQTMTMLKMFNQYDPARPDPTVQWAVDNGAISVEMPWGFKPLVDWTDDSLMTEARAMEHNANLEANRFRLA